MKFGTQENSASTARDGSQESNSNIADKVHEQNTGELNRVSGTEGSPAESKPPSEVIVQGNESNEGTVNEHPKDTGTDAPTVDSQGNALPGTDGNAAADSRAKLEQDANTKALDARLDQSKSLQEPGAKDKAQTYTSQARSDPSAADLGLDGEVERNQIETTLAESAAATAGHGTSDDGLTVYSSHPIQNLQLGPYHFEGTILKLTGSQVGDFEKLLEQLPMSERLNVSKLDTGKVDAIVASRQSAATQQFDSSAGKDALAALQKNFPKLGTVPIDGPTARSNVSQTDNNMEIPLTDSNG